MYTAFGWDLWKWTNPVLRWVFKMGTTKSSMPIFISLLSIRYHYTYFRSRCAPVVISARNHTKYHLIGSLISLLKGLITLKLKIILCALAICHLQTGRYCSPQILWCSYFTDYRGCLPDLERKNLPEWKKTPPVPLAHVFLERAWRTTRFLPLVPTTRFLPPVVSLGSPLLVGETL